MAQIAFVLDPREIEFDAVRAQGAGGQNVNKVSSAMVLRFDVHASSLPETLKQRVLQRADQRISSDGVIVIKAQEHRSQPRNREAAIERLQSLLKAAATIPRRRIATAPTRASRKRRLDGKTRKGQTKAGRAPVHETG